MSAAPTTHAIALDFFIVISRLDGLSRSRVSARFTAWITNQQARLCIYG